MAGKSYQGEVTKLGDVGGREAWVGVGACTIVGEGAELEEVEEGKRLGVRSGVVGELFGRGRRE